MFKTITGSIDPNSIGHFFSMSTWASALAFLYVLLATIIIIFIYKKKGRNFSILFSFIIGVIGLGIFTTVYNTFKPIVNEGEITWVNEAKNWLSIYTKIFFNLLFLIIPIFVFTSIVLLFINRKKGFFNKFFKSFLFLSLVPLLGIFFALIMIPLIKMIDPKNFDNIGTGSLEVDPDPITLPSMILSSFASSLLVLIAPKTIISVFVFAIFLSIIFLSIKKSKDEETFEKILSFFLIIEKIIKTYIKNVFILLPFVIATRMTTILMVENQVNNLELVGIYSGFYFFGFLMITIFIIFMILINSNKETKFSKKLNLIINHSIFAFANGNVITSDSSTRETSNKLGSREEITNMTISKSLFMGYVMCSGFTPTLVLLFTLQSTSGINILNVIMVAFSVFFLSLGLIGNGSSDFIIITSIIVSFNFNFSFYEFIFPFLFIFEPFSTIVNTLTHINIALLVNKFK